MSDARPLVWVEPCAGMAAVAMRLLGCEPLIRYMGGKREYAPAILDGLGIRAVSGCSRLVLSDAGPVGVVWEAFSRGEGEAIVARLCDLHDESERIGRRELWTRLRGEPAAMSGEDAAGWLVLAGWAFRAGQPSSGFVGNGRPRNAPRLDSGAIVRASALTVALRASALTVARDASALTVARDASARVVVFLDPPYLNTQGYDASLHREAVERIARDWADAGAEVLITERTPMDGLQGWRHVKIASSRNGASEWLCLSPSVRWQAGEAVDLWPGLGVPGGSAMTGGVGRRRK